MITQMRVRDEIAGYCITEFLDIEWEFTGIIDYLRNEKPGVVKDFATVNDDLLVAIEPSHHAVAPSESITVDMHIVTTPMNRTTAGSDGPH